MQSWFSEYKSTVVKAILICSIIAIALSLVYGFISGSISDFFNSLLKVLSPVIIGFVIAYLSNPLVTFFEKIIFKWIPQFTLRRLVSTIATLFVFVAFLAFIITMLLPSIASTLHSFWDSYIVEYKDSIIKFSERINSIMDQFSFLTTAKRLDSDAIIIWVQENLPWLEKLIAGDFSDLVTNEGNSQYGFNIYDLFVPDKIMSILGDFLSIGSSLINVIKDTVLGIFIAIYMLLSKERCKAYFRRFLNAILKPGHVRAVIRFGKLLDNSFGGFIEGQILDAIVVGVISYLTFTIFQIPIPHLLATIIAVTNVIPIFGPFIGGIPAALLVLLTSPEKVILFVLLIFIIQQIDGNIICPHILGDKINISSLATIVAIVTMGGLYGIFGMIIGVPVFAVIIHVINNYTLNSLRRKGYETSLKHYYVGNLEGISNTKNNTKADKISLSSIKELLTNIKNLFNKKKKNKEK